MEHIGDGKWNISIYVGKTSGLTYSYFVRRNDSSIINESGKPRHITLFKDHNCIVYDKWQLISDEKSFLSSAFTKSIFAREERIKRCSKPHLHISCCAPVVEKGQCLEIVGSNKKLGLWNPDMSLRMQCGGMPVWELDIPQSEVSYPFEYKFIIKDKDTNRVIMWEDGPNRYFNPLDDGIDYDSLEKDDILISGLSFNKYIEWRGAGVAIPVFSLRTTKGHGIGEFLDLKLLIDWCKKTNQKFIQILPVNDTTMTHTWTDSYPYNANSIFALNPVYINIESVGKLKDKKRNDYYSKRRDTLNQRSKIEFEEVAKDKLDYLREIYEQAGKKTLDSKEYKLFLQKNREWLIPYAAFCYLRDKYRSADFSKWGDYSTYDKNTVERLASTGSDSFYDITFYIFTQYHLDKQLREVTEYAHENGVVIKGDIPIGISRDSADAWADTTLFNMNSQAGAPPDDFSKDGQNWGFPTYNWKVMEEDKYSWWKKRFAKMSDYFDAYRIDHILGFFRIWEIPMNAVQGLLGHFSPAMPYYPDEMNKYGFFLNKERDTQPYIREYMLYDLFRQYTAEVKLNYLIKTVDDKFVINPRFHSQREIENYFTGHNDDKSRLIKSGLLKLTTEVLFVEDTYQKEKYHPRIGAHDSYSYKALDYEKRDAFNRLYDDFFYHRHNYFWEQQALNKLPELIEATDMLVCGEDLGMIPACVPDVMNKLQILSLEIERMPKQHGHEFGDTSSYPYLSVCTTSTHDMNPIRAWWEENKASTQRYYNNVLHRDGEAPKSCNADICEQIVGNHLNSPSMLCILPLQDLLSIDEQIRVKDATSERINIPAISRHYWRYRMHITLEELLKNREFNSKITYLVAKSGR